MRPQRLPEISRGSPEGDSHREHNMQGSRVQRFSYYKAMSELKQVNQKVWAVKNRLNFLLAKQQQAQSPHANNQQEKHSRLRTLAHEQQHQLREQLSQKRLKSQSEVEFKRRSNQIHRRETLQRIVRAKKEVEDERVRVYVSVREQRDSNLQLIDSFRHSFLAEKQTRRQMLYAQEQYQKKHVREKQEQRARQARADCQIETERILGKLQVKKAELRQVEKVYEEFQQIQEQRMAKHRERKEEKLDKLKKRRLITIETRSSEAVPKMSTPPSTSPHSWASFVVLL